METLMFGQKQTSQPDIAAPQASAPATTAAVSPVPEGRTVTTSPVRRTLAEGNEALVRSDLFRIIRNGVFTSMNVSAAVGKTRDQMKPGVEQLVLEIAGHERLNITISEQSQIVSELLNDMFGVGPIEPLLADDSVTDVLVNGPDQVYVERHGRLELTPYKFRDNAHVVNVAQRIAASVGRRVDESSPMVDARLADGSRVNVILPPLAIHGACIAIRKFSKRNITLHRMAQQGNMSVQMSDVLKLASACRLNIIVSGGTGSGKTTLLNALSHFIGDGERVITIEDAAELQLQQPHVVSLETRPENAEGLGGVAQRGVPKRLMYCRR
jgi:pilus assembly protein CpaF